MCHRYWPEEGSELYHIYEVRNNIIKWDQILYVYSLLHVKS
jgi:hypothetical protein